MGYEKKGGFQSIKIYKDIAPQISELEDDEAGKLFKAIFRYTCDCEDTDFSHCDRMIRSLWKTIKLRIDNQTKKGENYGN